MVSSLDIDAVRVFLEALGLSERYHAAFMEDGFDSLARVAAMDDDDLSAIPGMRRGHKKQIKAAIAQICVADAPDPLPPLPPPPASGRWLITVLWGVPFKRSLNRPERI